MPTPTTLRPISLDPLRGFEAAARLLSFTLAADEMHLTPSSVSRQVAELERQLGCALFVRKTRALELTAAGARLLAVVQQNLGALDRTVDELRGRPGQTRVTVSTYASFASLWLVPRLAQFQRLYPGIDIRIDATDRVVDLQAEDVDAAIRWVPHDRTPPGADVLMDDLIAPAVSPALLRGRTLRRPTELAQWPLLDLDATVPGVLRVGWPQWFAHAGAAGTEPRAGRLVFSYVDQAVQAGIRGQGVVLVRTPFLNDAVAAGDLVMPFAKLRMPTGYRHVLITRQGRRASAHLNAFVSWVKAEFARVPGFEDTPAARPPAPAAGPARQRKTIP